MDKPIAALLNDLETRGLLKDTLVIWSGEFGRTPHGQGADGRDHNNKGFSIWMAGGGIRGGITYGETDEFGHHAVKDIVNHYDYHATLLHLFGLDYKRVAFKRNGQEMSLVDGQAARLIAEILRA